MTSAPAARAVIFDLEGTLLQSEEVIRSSLDSATRFGGGRRGWSLLDLRDPTTTVRRARGDVDEFVDFLRKVDVEPVPGMVDALGSLHGHHALAVASNARRVVAHALLERSGLAGYFGAVISTDDVRMAKPDPEIIHRACSRLRVAAADAVVVGDSATDLLAASAAGARGVFAGWIGNTAPGPVAAVASEPAELREIIDRSDRGGSVLHGSPPSAVRLPS